MPYNSLLSAVSEFIFSLCQVSNELTLSSSSGSFRCIVCVFVPPPSLQEDPLYKQLATPIHLQTLSVCPDTNTLLVLRNLVTSISVNSARPLLKSLEITFESEGVDIFLSSLYLYDMEYSPAIVELIKEAKSVTRFTIRVKSYHNFFDGLFKLSIHVSRGLDHSREF